MTWPEIIQTDRLTLRRPTHHDAEAIFAGYAQDPEVVRYLMWRPHRTIDDTHEYLRYVDRGWITGAELTWALTFSDDDRAIGMFAIRPEGFKHNLGYVLGRRYWGQGLIVEAGRPIIELAFSDPAVYRVWAICDVDNHASARVLDKLGMTREGVLRRWIVHPNISPEPRDSLCYARVR